MLKQANEKMHIEPDKTVLNFALIFRTDLKTFEKISLPLLKEGEEIHERVQFLKKERLVEAAKKWADRGFQIVPLKLSLAEDGSKRVQPLFKWQTEAYPGFAGLDWAELTPTLLF
jgi:hypothetical protein